ncbi:HD domain-containing protein [Candidatus Gottesmanbacteria bacterium]|nr:HD domain-containing protein [Candidatus Gottesmanbacteria bacterium]
MIPTKKQARALWDKYQLPNKKRIHCALVTEVAMGLAGQIHQFTNKPINQLLLQAAALLHDIDKNVPKRAGEKHPDTAVRILREEGMDEIAAIVKTHSLHAILDPAIAPKTWEEKILFLADKMVKYEVIGVDERFKLWSDEHLPGDAQAILDAAYPKVKALEHELLKMIRKKEYTLAI